MAEKRNKKFHALNIQKYGTLLASLLDHLSVSGWSCLFLISTMFPCIFKCSIPICNGFLIEKFSLSFIRFCVLQAQNFVKIGNTANTHNGTVYNNYSSGKVFLPSLRLCSPLPPPRDQRQNVHSTVVSLGTVPLRGG